MVMTMGDDEKPKIMSIDHGVGESWSVETTVEFTDGKDGVDFMITSMHDGSWPSHPTSEEGYCHAREDQVHCEHWWDGDGCCSCGAPAMTQEEMIEQGMIDVVEMPQPANFIPVISIEEVPVSIEAKLTIGEEEEDVEAD